MTTTTRKTRRTLQGIVRSSACDKTITVLVEQRYKHPKYGKYLRRNKKYMAHDEENAAQPGDTVEIVAARPMSKRKRWRLTRVVEKSRFGNEPLAGGEA